MKKLPGLANFFKKNMVNTQTLMQAALTLVLFMQKANILHILWNELVSCRKHTSVNATLAVESCYLFHFPRLRRNAISRNNKFEAKK